MPENAPPDVDGSAITLVSRRIDAAAPAVSRALQSARSVLAERLPDHAVQTVEIVAAEALNNIVEHAMADRRRGPGRIDLCIKRAAQSLILIIDDDGAAMPNGTVPDGEPPRIDGVALDDLPEGGFGWSLIHRLSAALKYERRSEANRLMIWIDL